MKSKGGKWISVVEYAKKHKIKSYQVLYIWMLKNKVKWREVEVITKKKEIWDNG